MLRNTFHSALLALLCLGTGQALAQDVRYITDTLHTPLRSGAGNQFRIIDAGLASGTRLTVHETSEDGSWSRVTTPGGDEGWVRSQYLIRQVPAGIRLERALAENEQLRQKNSELGEQVASLRTERSELNTEVSDTGANLEQVTEELARLKQISGKAVQLDADNRRLTEEAETLRSEVDTLKAENQRLQDKLRSSAFIDGALAVLLGVIITLVVPRLWPKRRRSSSWA